MAEYFEAKAKFLKQQDNVLIKAVSEQYLVDALSFTEAETRITQELQGEKDLMIVAMKRSPIKEVVSYGDTDLWWKVTFSYMDAGDGEKEREIKVHLLVNADTETQASERTHDHLKEWLVPYEITNLTKSKIAEVYQHVPWSRSKKINDGGEEE